MAQKGGLVPKRAVNYNDSKSLTPCQGIFEGEVMLIECVPRQYHSDEGEETSAWLEEGLRKD